MTDATDAVPNSAASDRQIIRSFGDDLWSVVDLGEAFSKGFYVFGSAPALFRLSVSAACIDVLSQDVAKTPIQLRKRTLNGSELVLPKEHPAAARLERPSRFFGRRKFMRLLVTNLVMSSEYYLAVDRARDGTPREIQGIPKENVNRTVNNQARKRFYDIQASGLDQELLYGWASKKRMSDSDVAHLIARTMNGYDAIATNTIVSSSLGLLRQMQEYQSGIFNNGGMPVMAFRFPTELTGPQIARLKSDFTKAAKKARTEGTPLILEGADGVMPDVEKLSLTSVDGEFVKSHEAAGLDAARFFRVPPHKVYLLSSVKYDNQTEQERLYVDDALCPIFEVIEEGLEHVLLDEDERDEYFICFDRERAYAMKPEERHKIVNERWKNGQIEYDEMRQAIGLNAKGGDTGKVRMFSGNFVLVDEDNEVIMRAGGNSPNDPNAAGQDTNTPAGKAKGNSQHLRVVQE